MEADHGISGDEDYPYAVPLSLDWLPLADKAMGINSGNIG